MNFDYKDCLEKGKIKAYSRGPELAGKEMDEAMDDHKTAADSLKRGNHK